MADRQHIIHDIPPTYDERSRVLVLGTMPSPASRELGFNYGHPRNRFWQVMADLAGEPVPSTNERKRDFCLRHHIALWDVLAECDIEGASDASIGDARPNPLTLITEAAPIEAVFCTGAKAFELYRKLCEADVGIKAVRLPSTSPANAACKLEELREAYAQVFEHEHAFEPPVCQVDDVVALERTIDASGTTLRELMERAGTSVAWRVSQIVCGLKDQGYAPRDCADRDQEPCMARCWSAEAPYVTIMCGNGNNGGDGWVAAAQLAQAGQPVCLIATRHPDQLSAQPAHDAALAALNVLKSCGARVVGPMDGADIIERINSGISLVLIDPTREQCAAAVGRSCVVVDAIMGTGSGGDPRHPFDMWIDLANAHRSCQVSLAVDVPSGISARDGCQGSPHFLADETMTMIVRKPGLSAPACGDVKLAALTYIEPYFASEGMQ